MIAQISFFFIHILLQKYNSYIKITRKNYIKKHYVFFRAIVYSQTIIDLYTKFLYMHLTNLYSLNNGIYSHLLSNTLDHKHKYKCSLYDKQYLV